MAQEEQQAGALPPASFFDLGSLGFLPIRWFQKLQVFLFVSLFVLIKVGGGSQFFLLQAVFPCLNEASTSKTTETSSFGLG